MSKHDMLLIWTLASLAGCAALPPGAAPSARQANAEIRAAQAAVRKARIHGFLWTSTPRLLIRAARLQTHHHFRQAAHLAAEAQIQCRLAAKQHAANRRAQPFYPPAYRVLPRQLWPPGTPGS
ncbi:MAG: hypothetical protein M0Z76_00130 [Gammaproteobacteria bacterium]|nr:hypothetical protein [Gammaproteobacteria bacterium]